MPAYCSYVYEYYRGEDEAMWEDEQDELSGIAHEWWKQAEVEDEENLLSVGPRYFTI